MKTIGSHPGAILFRLGLMFILIAILMIVFLSYLDETERVLERTSVLQTKKIIDSSLAVVFATYAVNNRLDELDKLDGGNPFVFLQEFEILPPAYVGATDSDLTADQAPGWYYLSHHRIVVYKSRFIESDSYFKVMLNYDDRNQSGSFESNADKFRNLQFVKKIEL